MSKPAIEVRNVGKKFVINHKNKASYSTLKDDIGNIGKRIIGRNIDSSEEDFWALKDVSFDVPKGEIFGVIGKNGSGKSTLLKILSRIISPTEGDIKLRGKVASLLEVGTGFHPELTGRENVYFNGSMLGMKRSEITRKFQEIVDFSEIEKFIDTPVKFYSSGMYVRLAFAVAAHLEPEILILDEVLAVGDASFQKKSMNKILSTMREGRTVLFVSHNTAALRQLCTTGILLKQGEVAASGNVGEIIDQYMIESENNILAPKRDFGYTWERTDIENEIFKPLKVYIVDSMGSKVTGPLLNNQSYQLCIEGDLKTNDTTFNIGYGIWDQEAKNLIYQTSSNDSNKASWPEIHEGRIKLSGDIPGYLLNEGTYRLTVTASLYGKSWVFDLESSPIRLIFDVKHGKRESPRWKDPRGGIIAPIIIWRKG